MTRSYLRLSSKLPECDKPRPSKTRHRISKKEVQDYYLKMEEIDVEEE